MKFLRYTLILLAFMSLPAIAREAVVGMNERVLNDINKVQELIDAEQYASALKALEDLQDRRLSPYESAHVLNLEGFVYYQLEDIPRAKQSYERALSQKALPDSLVATLLLTLGRLGLLQQDYGFAVDKLKSVLAMKDQDQPVNRVLLANAYVGLGKHKEALSELTRAIEETRAEGKQPRENWLGLLAGVYYELGDFTSMRDVTRELVQVYPREQYILNLAALLGQLGDEKRQLALVESLLEDGRLSKEHQLKMAANLYLALDLPYKAARLLESSMASGRIESNEKSLEQLSQAWLSAAEVQRAIVPLEQAATMSATGDTYLRLARLRMDAYQFEEAADAARAAIRKGGMREEGGAWLLWGMALARMNQWDRAAEALARAADFDDTQRYAGQWLAYVNDEQQRASVLAADS
jgi:tetratricopeptide (TPR) repeat protein